MFGVLGEQPGAKASEQGSRQSGWQKQESLAGKGFWEDGRNRRETQTTLPVHLQEGRRARWGARICTERQQTTYGDGEQCRHPWTIPCPHGKTLQGAAGRAGPGATHGGHEHEGRLWCQDIISPRLPNRVFWLSQLKIRLLLIISTGLLFSFLIYLYYGLPCGRKT